MYYESATLQHGKPSRLPDGAKHVGLFLHFRPKFWAERGYVKFTEMRGSKSIKIEKDARARHKKQEGWEKFFYEWTNDVSEYADLKEGNYFSLRNNCSDPAEQRDDVAFLRLGRSWYDDGEGAVRGALGEALLKASKSGQAQEVERLLHQGAAVGHHDRLRVRVVPDGGRTTFSMLSSWDLALQGACCPK